MLKLCESFFNYLNMIGIKYCHWKSNSSLSRALNGGTDLDLLIDANAKPEFESVLNRYEFKKIISDPTKRIPWLEDYLGLDYASGRLIHLHVHYRLILGQRYIKNHHLPIEALIFENLTTKLGVSIPCPEMELALLIIRANFKLGATSILKHMIANAIGKSFTPYPADINGEIKELIAASDIEKLKIILRQTKLPLSEELFTGFIDKYIKGKLRFYDVMRYRGEILRNLRAYRRDKGGRVVLRYYMILIKSLPGIRRYMRNERKTLAGRGLVISILGADGSGKSTIVHDLTTWLSWKLDVEQCYYGIPKTFHVKAWSLAIRGFKKVRLDRLSTLLKALLWVYVARLRSIINRNSRYHASQKKIVITDRFPLKEFRNMAEPMDGPRLAFLRGTTYDNLAREEEDIYRRIEMPDHIFVLQADVHELRRRKSDLELVDHKLKVEAVNAISESPLVTIIEANRPYREVLMKIKRKLWEII